MRLGDCRRSQLEGRLLATVAESSTHCTKLAESPPTLSWPVGLSTIGATKKRARLLSQQTEAKGKKGVALRAPSQIRF